MMLGTTNIKFHLQVCHLPQFM